MGRGSSEFELNSEVKFTFINASDVADPRFAIWERARRHHRQQIHDVCIFNVDNGDGDILDWLQAVTAPNTENRITVAFTAPRTAALNCLDETESGLADDSFDYANIITLRE